jgi:RNA recognition motif-containing protein
VVTVKLLIRNLPARTQRKELRRLVSEAFKQSLLTQLFTREEPEILSCDRFRAIDPRNGDTEYWCILVVRPEAAAERVIKRLHGQSIAGRRVVVKQYIDRCGDDRRYPPQGDGNDPPPPDSLPERRRPLIIEPVEDVTSDAYQDVTSIDGVRRDQFR